MSANEIVESVLSTTDCNDLGIFLDKAVAKGGTDARCCPNHEDMSVLERHFVPKDLMLSGLLNQDDKGVQEQGFMNYGLLAWNHCLLYLIMLIFDRR